METLWKVMK